MSFSQRWTFYIHYALRSLRREGIRTILAGLSITFGVLSLISMQLLSNTLMHGAMFDEQIQYGGDARIESPDWTNPLSETDLAQIKSWQGQGLIRSFTPLSRGTAQYLHTTTNSRVTFLMNVVGFDPASYPLVGTLELSSPASKRPADVLVNPTDALITHDIAESLGFHVGDTFVIGGGDVAATEMTVAGIVSVTPSQQGKGVFYSLDTARLLENRADVVTAVPILWGDAPNAEQTIVDSPLNVFVARSRDEVSSSTSDSGLFDMMLKGAGVLGLLVGGLGVSNTLQVILARRKLEIAMLKTLGGQRRTLLLIIGLETGLLGLVSSIIGTAAGVFVAAKLLGMLGRIGVFMVNWTPDIGTLLGGILAGTCTAVVFGLQAILASSATRPIELLRDLPVKTPIRVMMSRGLLFGVLIVIFGALVGVALGSVPNGILYVLGGSLFLLVLRGVFWVVLWILFKLPVPLVPTLKLARSNLNRRKMQSSLIVIALFAGVFAMTFAVLIIYNAQNRLMNQRPSDAGYNLMVFTSPDQINNVRGRLVLEGVNTFYTRYLVNGTLNNAPVEIEGRSEAELAADVSIDSAWSGAENTALLSSDYASAYAVGDVITLHAIADAEVTIAGFYTATGDYETNIARIQAAAGIIVSPQTALALGGARTQVQVVVDVPVAQLNVTTDALGTALPNALIFSKSDITNLMVSTYQALFSFAVSIASLAFFEGAVLIANSAGLTVVERRREIGVFKAVGYTSGHVLRLLISEYGLLGLLAGIFGIIATILSILLINASQPGAQMVIEPLIVGGMLLLSVVLAAISAALIAWQPTRVRPLDVLRYE